jgi:hypothetical protein
MTLFSTVIAALLSVTIPDLKQNPQDTSAFYLENMYKLQVLAGSNASLPSTPTQPPRFSAPKYAIWVNTLLFMSLCLNLFTAYLALWTRATLPEYLLDIRSTQSSPHYRARMFQLLSSEWAKSLSFKVPISSLLLSPLLFFVGLSIYLFNLNKFVFGPILCCVCLCFVAFGVIFNWLGNVSTSYHSLYLFVVFAQIMADSRFIRRLRTGRNHQRGSTTASWTSYLILSLRIPTLWNSLRESLASANHQ